MMNLSKNIIFAFALCIAANFSIGQVPKKMVPENEYQAIHWGIEDGLSKDASSFFLKDINGFVWMSTDYGLNRFDGSTFKKYFADRNSNKTITANYVTRLIEDSLHNIWVGTVVGLCRYDIKADTFTHFYVNPNAGNSDSSIHPFFATKDSVYCIESLSQITAYSVHSLSKKILTTLKPGEYFGYNMAILYTLFDKASNSVWMSEGDAGKSGGGLLQISLSDGNRNYYTWSCYRHIPNHGHCSEGMCYDKKRNCIWMNTPDGLVQFTLSDKKFHRTDALNQIVNQKNYDRGTVGIDLDELGRIWFATDPKGIIIYDPSNQSITYPFPKDSVLQHEVSGANMCVYCDRRGITWSSSWIERGIYQLNPFTPCVQRYSAVWYKSDSLSNNNVISCVDVDTNHVLIGTQYGLNILDQHTGRFKVLLEEDLHAKKGGETVIPLGVNTSLKKAWLDLSDGFNEMNLLTYKCRAIIFKDSLGNVIKRVGWADAVPYKGGCIVEGTYNNRKGIFILSPDSITAHQILDFPGDDIALINIATDGHLLFLFDQKTHTTLTYSLQNNKWLRASSPLDSVERTQHTKIFYDKNDQTYWLIHERQLLQYNHNFHLVNKYEVNQDVPGKGIFAMIRDNSGFIWLNNDRSLCRLDPRTRKITILTERDGFKKQYFNEDVKPMRDDFNGDLYFPPGIFNGKGFDRIIPDKFKENYPPSSVYFQSLEINQQPFLLSTGANALHRLSLKYFQNKITIETGTIDYYSKGKNQIRYKLEPLNSEWQYAPAYYTIRYDGLAANNYKLIVQASNAANEFNGPPKILLINISPAFWNTWWFRTLATIFILAAFYVVIRYRAHQKFRLRLERSENSKQLAELQQQKTEMEMQALRAQMNPHFIFNSLNSINRFILQNNKAQASEYLTKFSKLVRMILQNSQASLISLETELESLGLYLEMEALRFNYHFDYKISFQKDLDIEVLKVPPLILQPYIENAIWHGLMHKEEKGQLDIEVSQEDDLLFFKITDDGIGRKQATALASKSATKHKSMGLKITADRIAMLQSSNGKESPVTINDLTEPDGSAAGTEVIIKIPVIYD